MNKQIVNQEVLQRYRDAWACYDPSATGYIESKNFPGLMLKFGPPLGWDKSFEGKPKK